MRSLVCIFVVRKHPRHVSSRQGPYNPGLWPVDFFFIPKMTIFHLKTAASLLEEQKSNY